MPSAGLVLRGAGLRPVTRLLTGSITLFIKTSFDSRRPRNGRRLGGGETDARRASKRFFKVENGVGPGTGERG